MKTSILVALNDSLSSHNVLNYMVNASFSREATRINLIHVFRKPSSGEELMGKHFMINGKALYD